MGGEGLFFDVGVADGCCGEGLVDQGFHDGGVDADRDVAFHPVLGPVPDWAEMQEVFEGPEPGLDMQQLPEAVTILVVDAWLGVRLVVST